MSTPTSGFQRFIQGFNRVKKAGKNFVKSSALSLIVLALILGLLLKMDQALTLLVEMMENPGFKLDLLISLSMISALALALSHYPIYTYYAANLNGSGDYTEWETRYPVGRWYPVYVFVPKTKSTYKPDLLANIFRYTIGMILHGAWIVYILNCFKPKLVFIPSAWTIVCVFSVIFSLIPWAVYVVYKTRLSRESRRKQEITAMEEGSVPKWIIRLGRLFVLFAVLSMLTLVLLLIWGNFSMAGLVLLFLCSWLLMLNYVFFRLLRTRLGLLRPAMEGISWILPRKIVLAWFALERSENYILLFHVCALMAFAVMGYSTLAVIFGWTLLNGIPVLLCFLYFYFFLIANLWKYYFVVPRLDLVGSSRHKAIFGLTSLLSLLVLISFLDPGEVRTHELDLVEQSGLSHSEVDFLDRFESDQKTYLFIASHGGGLKANAWTLQVMQSLQEASKGRAMERAIAFSGASGGSLGLALYGDLVGNITTDTGLLQARIDKLVQRNYTTVDLTLMFGLDTYRKLWPLNRIQGKDRPFYKMRLYHRLVIDNQHADLPPTPYREHWNSLTNELDDWPTLIMNTASTKGKRGIAWTVDAESFDDVFPFSIDLNNIPDNRSLSFYQAVSTTNRFPFFSPAAKVKGIGHFIDAGAIDNSGLLGCVDLYNYLESKEVFEQNKNIVFVEIINSKSLYINYLISLFKYLNNLEYIPLDENETDNVIADLNAGLNLDKFPGYLSESMQLRSTDSTLHYFPVYMPHAVRFEDIESQLGGRIELDNGSRDLLHSFLQQQNQLISEHTEEEFPGFFSPWKYYDPVLSRHLNSGSLRYIKAIQDHPQLQAQFRQIDSLLRLSPVSTEIESPGEAEPAH